MSKRLHHQDQDGGARPSKRAKPTPTSTPQSKPPPPEQIHFARQLSTLLTFDQTDIPRLRTGIASFKAFLESILYRKDEDDRGRQLSILREYLESEKPTDSESKDTSTEKPFLQQLWQAWSFASHGNNDSLTSSVSALLALLVKTLGSLVDFTEFGVLLCRSVLRQEHLRLVRRSLDAGKQKEFLVSPVLRLLTEVTAFDGGVCARGVWRGRELCFDPAVVRRLLGWTRSGQDEEEARRKPAVRTLTVRYALTVLKYLHEGGKAEVLRNRALCSALFQYLKDDPADVVIELLNGTEQYVLKDGEMPRSAKAGLLLESNLEKVTEIATRSSEEHGAATRAFEWLKAVCTKLNYGILRASGWYPPGTTSIDNQKRRKGTIDLGLDSVDFYDRTDKPVVRNTALLTWIQTLRPHSNLQERELVLTCFKSAPELVAAYFAEKPMQLEPKLSNTWIGYASFLFEIVRLPVPAHFGHEEGWAQLPPQTYIMLDSILPRPLTQKVLTRCLNQSSELITFFAIRILILALEKLAEVGKQLAKAVQDENTRTELWHEVSTRLTTSFISRLPSMKDIISTFRKLPDDEEHALQQEGITRLLRLCYEVLPVQSLEESFDISASLTTALVRAEDGQEDGELERLQKLRLEHLLQIAKNSPGMRWLSKQGSLRFSPLVTLLRIHTKDIKNERVRELTSHVLMESNVADSRGGSDALIAALYALDSVTDIVGDFLDDCFERASRKPVKYVDLLETLGRTKTGDDEACSETLSIPSLLAGVLLEQTPFVMGKPAEERDVLQSFICAFIDMLQRTTEASEVLNAVQSKIQDVEGFSWSSTAAGSQVVLDQISLDRTADPETEHTNNVTPEEPTLPFAEPPLESESHPELLKWSQKDLDLALDDNSITALILCLSSQYPEIRSQALTQLHKLEDKLLASSFEDRDPIYILVGELIETYEVHFRPFGVAMPYLVSCFATHALEVQRQPIHFMYPKINAYLNKGPEWRTHKLPTYWMDNTILSQPEEDDAYWKEVLWVLDWMVDGLRTADDLNMLRKVGAFERVMGLYASPGARREVEEKVLELIWRVTWVDEGSSTLITRTGVLAWLDMMRKQKGSNGYEGLLKKRVLETCETGRVEEWSGVGGLEAP